MKRKLQEEEKEEEFDADCDCVGKEFCNAALGYNRGFCEECKWFPTLNDCKGGEGEDAFPSLGIKDCQFKCFE